MRIGIDYGDTISKYPEFFALLTKWLKESGHKIYIIVGRNYQNFSGDNIELQVIKTYEKSLKEKNVLYDFIIPHDDRIHMDTDKQKGKFCDKEKIEIMFDNDDGYISDIKRWSKNTKIIKVN